MTATEVPSRADLWTMIHEQRAKVGDLLAALPADQCIGPAAR